MLPSNMPNIVKHLSSVVLNMLSSLMHSNSFTCTVMRSPAQQLVESKPGSRAPDITRMRDLICLSRAVRWSTSLLLMFIESNLNSAYVHQQNYEFCTDHLVGPVAPSIADADLSPLQAENSLQIQNPAQTAHSRSITSQS